MFLSESTAFQSRGRFIDLAVSDSSLPERARGMNCDSEFGVVTVLGFGLAEEPVRGSLL